MKCKQSLFFLASTIIMFSVTMPAYGEGLVIIEHKTTQEGLFNDSVTAVAPAGDAGVFIASGGGLHIFLDYYFLPVFQNIPAVDLAQDPDGGLWAATDTGLIYRVTDRDGIWTSHRRAFDKAGEIRSLAADHGVVIVGTDSGLYCSNDSDDGFHSIFKKGTYTALAVLPDGTIVAGIRDDSHKKGGLLVIGGSFAGKSGWVSEFSDIAVTAISLNGKRLLLGTGEGTLFVCDDAGTTRIDLPDSAGPVASILADGNMVVVAARGGLFGVIDGAPPVSLSTDDGLTISRPTSLAPGPSGGIWVGTQKDGVYLVSVRP